MNILQNHTIDHLYTHKIHLQGQRIVYLIIFLRLFEFILVILDYHHTMWLTGENFDGSINCTFIKTRQADLVCEDGAYSSY